MKGWSVEQVSPTHGWGTMSCLPPFTSVCSTSLLFPLIRPRKCKTSGKIDSPYWVVRKLIHKKCMQPLDNHEISSVEMQNCILIRDVYAFILYISKLNKNFIFIANFSVFCEHIMLHLPSEYRTQGESNCCSS